MEIWDLRKHGEIFLMRLPFYKKYNFLARSRYIDASFYLNI